MNKVSSGQSRLSSIRISKLFYCLLVVSAGIVFWLNGQAAPPYIICGMILVLPLALTPITHPYRFYILIMSVSLYFAYLLRPLVLLSNPDYYKYELIGTVSAPEIIERLWGLVPLIASFVGGCLAFVLLISPTVHPFVALEDKSGESGESMLFKGRNWILVFGWIVLLGNISLALFFNIGVKNVEVSAPQLQAISRLLPQQLMTAFAVAMFALHRKKMDPFSLTIIVAFLMATGFYELLIRGSKAGLAFIMFSFFVVHIVRFNDFQLRMRGVVALMGASVVCLLVAFSLSNVVRYGESDEGLINRASSAVTQYSGNVDIGKSVDDFTGRMCGFDGQLVVQQHRPVKLRRAFQITTILRNSIARVVPGMSPGSFTTGKAIAVHYQGAAEHAKFSGGVGLFGTFSLISFGKEWLGALLVGLTLGLIFRLLHFVRDPGIFIVLQVIFFYCFIQLVISGGIGIVIAILFLSLVQCFALTSVLKLFGSGLGKRSTRSLSQTQHGY